MSIRIGDRVSGLGAVSGTLRDGEYVGEAHGEALIRESDGVVYYCDRSSVRLLEAEKNKEQFATGAQRDRREGKGRFDLISPEPAKVLALVMEAGARKYGDRNWEKGMPFSRAVDSLERHINQFKAGEEDEDHLGHALANLWFLVTFRERVRKGKLPGSLADMGPLPIFTPRPGLQGLPDTVRDEEGV